MKRSFAIGDIHGCARTFRHLLVALIKVRMSDTLYLLGDYIDRGPDSKGVLDSIIDMQRKGYDIKPVLGNHEELLLDAVDMAGFNSYGYWMDNGGMATLKSYGVDHPAKIPAAHLDFMRSLPACRVTCTHVLVHAGLDFSLTSPLGETSRQFMLWERDFQIDSAKIAGRKIATGHSIRTLDVIRESLGSEHIRLDNGCFYGKNHYGKGNLVALELNSGELFVQQYID